MTELLVPSRRGFLFGLLATPAIVKFNSLMPLKVWQPELGVIPPFIYSPRMEAIRANYLRNFAVNEAEIPHFKSFDDVEYWINKYKDKQLPSPQFPRVEGPVTITIYERKNGRTVQTGIFKYTDTKEVLIGDGKRIG